AERPWFHAATSPASAAGGRTVAAHQRHRSRPGAQSVPTSWNAEPLGRHGGRHAAGSAAQLRTTSPPAGGGSERPAVAGALTDLMYAGAPSRAVQDGGTMASR